MLTDYFEPFLLLERSALPDGMGGEEVSWVRVLEFTGALTHTPGNEITPGAPALRLTPVLLHDPDITLTLGDWVRRVRDGSLWQVKGHSGNMRTPAFAALQFAQVPVERQVL